MIIAIRIRIRKIGYFFFVTNNETDERRPLSRVHRYNTITARFGRSAILAKGPYLCLLT